MNKFWIILGAKAIHRICQIYVYDQARGYVDVGGDGTGRGGPGPGSGSDVSEVTFTGRTHPPMRHASSQGDGREGRGVQPIAAFRSHKGRHVLKGCEGEVHKVIP